MHGEAIGESEVLDLGRFSDFDRLFEVLSLAADHAEDWEAQLLPVEDDFDEPDVYDIFGYDDADDADDTDDSDDADDVADAPTGIDPEGAIDTQDEV